MGNAAAIAAAFGGVLPPGISGTNDRCTVLVSNLNPDVSLSRSHKLFLSLSLLSHTCTRAHSYLVCHCSVKIGFHTINCAHSIHHFFTENRRG